MIAATNLRAVRERRFSSARRMRARRLLWNTSTQQLQLLNTNFGASTTSPRNNTLANGGDVTLTGAAIDMLRVIAENSARIASNTSAYWDSDDNRFAALHGQTGIRLADGGPIGGLPHSLGGTMINAERDEYMIRKSSARMLGIDALDYMNETGRLPSRTTVVPLPTAYSGGGSNSEVVAELKALRRENAEQRKEMADIAAKLAGYIGKAVDAGAEKVSESIEENVGETGRRVSEAIRMNTRDPRRA